MKSINVLTITLTTIVATVISSSNCQAQLVPLGGGEVTLDFDETVLNLAGISVTSVSSDVVTSGPTFDVLTFDINSRDDANPTTFEYTVDTVTPVSGTVETAGSISFTATASGSSSIGNIQFGFDATRVDAVAGISGFFAESTTGGFTGTLFDIGDGFPVVANETNFSFSDTIFLSDEFSTFLLGNDGAGGISIGTFAINAVAVPEPTGLACCAVFGIAMTLRRRRKSSI